MDKHDVRNLKRRYLVWMYKTTKEAFDKYERKFTQLEIDKFVLQEVEKEFKGAYLPQEKEALEKSVNEFKAYIEQKEKESLQLKYKGKKTNPDFLFLDVKLQAIEKAIAKELGLRMLSEIKALYEAEMIARILNSNETK